MNTRLRSKSNKNPGCGGGRNRADNRRLITMSLSKFITWLRGNQDENDRFMRVVGFCVKLYLVTACVWAICKLLSEILAKMGVG